MLIQINTLVYCKNSCIFVKEITTKKNIMKATFYIWNTKTDEHFDTNENRFYGANWEIDYLESEIYLNELILNNPDQFENCIVVDKNA